MKGTTSLKSHLSCCLLIILSISLSFTLLPKGVISQEYFNVKKYFSPRRLFLKIQLTLFINKCGNCIIWKQICMVPFFSEVANKHLKWERNYSEYFWDFKPISASPSFRFSIQLYVGQNKDFDMVALFVQSFFFCTSNTFTVLSIHLQLNCADMHRLWVCGLPPAGWLKFDLLFMEKLNTQ